MYSPLPHNEDARIEALKQYEILDTADEAAYDDIVQLAASICNAPMAAISLVDEYRQWFKARVGIGFRDTDRDMAICAHAITRPDQTLIVPDTLLDERFSLFQYVVSKPNIRFYVGVPLVNPEGFVLGTLCVMDRDCRGISHTQIESLQVLARQVITHLELRRTRVRMRCQADTLTRFREVAPVVDSALAGLLHGITEIRERGMLTDNDRDTFEKIDASANELLKALVSLQSPRNEATKVADAPVIYSPQNMPPPPPPVEKAPPIEKPAVPPVAQTVETPVQVGSTSRRPSLPKVLVADDNEMNCIVLASILEHHGCEVVCVENGEDALQKLALERFELVFMDSQMPRLDGVQTARTIRRMPSPICHVPIVAMGAGLVPNEQAQGREAGMNDFISKPISERAIKGALDRWVVRADATALI